VRVTKSQRGSSYPKDLFGLGRKGQNFAGYTFAGLPRKGGDEVSTEREKDRHRGVAVLEGGKGSDTKFETRR